MNLMVVLVVSFFVAVVMFEAYRFVSGLQSELKRSIEQLSNVNAQLLVLLAHRDVGDIAGRSVLMSVKKPREESTPPQGKVEIETKPEKKRFTMTVGLNPTLPEKEQ